MKSKRKSRNRRKKESVFNTFFDRIFVISLEGKDKKYNKVKDQFKRQNIKVERFIAINGMCKDDKELCKDKLKTFEILYDVTIKNPHNLRLKELLPASSLTLGTLTLLRYMVKHKLKYIFIAEDDIELTRNINEKLLIGLLEIDDYKWDLLYLSGGGEAGRKGVSKKQDSYHKYPSQNEEGTFVFHKDDLRIYCPPDICKPFSEHISHVRYITGTWSYAVSLEGAKKILKLIDANPGEHIDVIYRNNIADGKLKALAFEPVITIHEGGLQLRATESTIPWGLK